jgi:hypothetical protein
MLLKQLSSDDKRDFLCIAELLSIADKPLLRADKLWISIPAGGSFGTKISIQRGERESAAMDELVWNCDRGGDAALDYASGGRFGRKGIESALLKHIDKLPQHTAEEPAARAAAAFDVLREVLKGRKAEMPSVPKVMLFELMVFALAKGSISSIEWQLLNEFRHHHQLEDHIFDDLLERAECTHREAQKTLAIILE